MKYSFTIAALAAVVSAQDFTSIYNITATPDQVIGAMGPAPGQPGARGQFNYAINSKTDTICYDITLTGVTGEYQSAARTATHIHEAAKGAAGPPRIAFPNPGPITDGVRRSVGCLTGPFVTGIMAADNVTDTGAGFTVAEIEANPAGFFTDSHTALFVPGVVRGQMDQSFEIIDGDDMDDGSVITTATLTSTQQVTVTKCPAKKTDCPANEQTAVVTMTEMVYTTVCPISELPSYTAPVETKPVETMPGAPVYTKPAESMPVYPTSTMAGDSMTTMAVAPTGTVPGPAATTTQGVQFTGAASANKVGGALMVAGLAAALL
jgi:hypothetical protein